MARLASVVLRHAAPAAVKAHAEQHAVPTVPAPKVAGDFGEKPRPATNTHLKQCRKNGPDSLTADSVHCRGSNKQLLGGGGGCRQLVVWLYFRTLSLPHASKRDCSSRLPICRFEFPQQTHTLLTQPNLHMSKAPRSCQRKVRTNPRARR